jgi:transposase
VEHTLPEEELASIFPDGCKRLPDEVYKELEYIPSAFEVHEHHVAVYAARKGDTIVKADRPKRLLGNSILTPSLGAAVINAKYVNAIPINRISAEFARHDAAISRQVMAGWMIRLAERYLSLIYDEMHDAILQNRLIHCDETPFIVAEDQKTRGPTAKSYMWLYHATGRYGTPPIFLYEYQPTRKADNPRGFLRDYKGILMTDGYQVYHTLADERPEELRVAGCWSHLKRRYAEIIKASGIKNVHGTIADEANRRIAAIYHLDNMFKEAPDAERLDNRRRSVKPLVDAFFDWVKATEPLVDHSSKTGAALDYSINQERYLRAFLDDPDIPLDNNDAERSIRTFCVGKHAWHVVDSVNGAKASGMIYSVSETAKANGLVPYYYFRYLFEELPKHMEDKSTDFIKDLLPWSDKLPPECRPKPKTI